jgi:uncharacterized protein YqgC (DUF456 family)
MEYIIELVITHGPYVAICLVIAFLLTAAKKTFSKFFKTDRGKGILYFAPAVVGALLGLFLPVASLKLQLLYGAACGTASQTVYSIFKKGLRLLVPFLKKKVEDDEEPV